MHSQPTNMDLQEGMVTKGIQYIHLTHPKIFTWNHVNVFDKYLHQPCVGVQKQIIHDNNISVVIKSSNYIYNY